jgi:hypothetical protein
MDYFSKRLFTYLLALLLLLVIQFNEVCGLLRLFLIHHELEGLLGHTFDSAFLFTHCAFLRDFDQPYEGLEELRDLSGLSISRVEGTHHILNSDYSLPQLSKFDLLMERSLISYLDGNACRVLRCRWGV